MLRRPCHVFTCICAALFLFPLAAPAWNSPGHIIIALIAYDQLDPATRTKALDLIRSHPRFNDHFLGAIPREVKRASESVQDEWLFSHAATWPDQVRTTQDGVNHQDVSQFNRPFWHYINEPIFLNEGERRQLQGEIRTNRRRDPPPDTDETNMNIIQALKNSAHIVGDRNTPPEKRSVHLCWVMHLAGDSHQPLHSAALYTTHRFREGDRGGNDLEYEHGWKLHAFWDEQITNDEPFETLRILATDLAQSRKHQAAGKQAAATLDPVKWIDESFEFANKFGYTKELLKKVSDREGHSRLGPLDLPSTYRMNAEDVSERRAVEAGQRLAAAMKQMLQ